MVSTKGNAAERLMKGTDPGEISKLSLNWLHCFYLDGVLALADWLDWLTCVYMYIYVCTYTCVGRQQSWLLVAIVVSTTATLSWIVDSTDKRSKRTNGVDWGCGALGKGPEEGRRGHQWVWGPPWTPLVEIPLFEVCWLFPKQALAYGVPTLRERSSQKVPTLKVTDCSHCWLFCI